MTIVEVFTEESGRLRLVGQAHFTRSRGQISTTFLYDPGYLLGTGTTGPGGARPKASVRLEDGGVRLEDGGVRLEDGGLAIAKFPHSGDAWDVMAWKATALDLMESVGIRAPQHRLTRVGGRNHGFLSDRGSWTLSPAFDVNPDPDITRVRSTSIMGADTMPEEVDGLLALAEDCNLTADQASARISRTAAALASWRERAGNHQIIAREITMMAESIDPRLEALAKAGRP